MNPAEAAVRGPSSTACHSALRSVMICLIFLASFGASCATLEHFLSFPSVPEIAPRLRYFAERKDEFDTVFIGSSRVRHGIVPAVFDQETAAHGAGTRSFNLGYSGMWPPESFYYLRQVLAFHPRHLHWVVIELMDYRFGEAEQQPATMRMVYWHDWRHTAMALRLVLESPLPLAEKASQFARHSWLFVERLAHPGRGAEWLNDHYFPTRKEPDPDRVGRRGFDPEVETGEWSESAQAAFARQVETVTNSLPVVPARPGLVAALRDLLDELHRAGVEPLFILPPTVRPAENIVGGLPPGLTLAVFNHPADYPQLYDYRLHYDPGHLNEAGAREFTRLVAQSFLQRTLHRW